MAPKLPLKDAKGYPLDRSFGPKFLNALPGISLPEPQKNEYPLTRKKIKASAMEKLILISLFPLAWLFWYSLLLQN
jgi:hypothetical protein